MATGRAISAAIASRLRSALDSGQPRTYAELAKYARCTERSVRNYLDQAASTLGVRVERHRGPDRRVRVRLQEDAAATIEDLARVLAKEMLRGVFPIAGTSLEHVTKRPSATVVVAVRGAYEYEEGHLRLLRDYLRAATERPRRQVRFAYEGTTASGVRAVWPLGIVVRDLARVYLLGVPADSLDARDVRTYALERVLSKRIEMSPTSESGRPPKGIDSAPIRDAMDLPFSISSGRGGVHVHVRFAPGQAKFIRGRRWHEKQKVRTLKDGSLDVRFGPVDAGEAKAWLAQWSDGIVSSSLARDGTIVPSTKRGAQRDA